MATFVELDIDQGSTFQTTVTLTDDTSNTTLNLVGYTAQAQLRRSFYSANASGNLTCTFADAQNGSVLMAITAANSSNLVAGRHLYDLKITDPNGVTSRPIEGIAIVWPRVTR